MFLSIQSSVALEEKFPEKYEVEIEVVGSERSQNGSKPYWQKCYDAEPHQGWCGTCDDNVSKNGNL